MGVAKWTWFNLMYEGGDFERVVLVNEKTFSRMKEAEGELKELKRILSRGEERIDEPK